MVCKRALAQMLLIQVCMLFTLKKVWNWPQWGDNLNSTHTWGEKTNNKTAGLGKDTLLLLACMWIKWVLLIKKWSIFVKQTKEHLFLLSPYMHTNIFIYKYTCLIVHTYPYYTWWSTEGGVLDYCYYYCPTLTSLPVSEHFHWLQGNWISNY